MLREETVNIHGPDGAMPAFLCMPAMTPKGRVAAVLLVQEAFGVNQHMREVTRRLAHEGYIVITPEFFHRQGSGIELEYDNFDKVKPYLVAMTDEQVRRDLAATLTFLDERFSVKPGEVAVMGFCLGGRIAMVSATAPQPIATVISYYGGGMVEPKPELGFTLLIQDFKNIECPVLMFFGEKDPSIPMAHVEKIRGELKKQKKDFEIHTYAEAGHAFTNEDRPSNFNAEATKDAWAKTLDWLKKLPASKQAAA